MKRANLVQVSRQAIAKGSKTFDFASRFFPKENFEDAAILYNWCRHVDDAIDAAPPEERLTKLSEVRAQTQAAIAGSEDTEPAYQGLAYILRRHSIPAHYPLELIEGMAMDVQFQPPRNLAALELYSYRVAGVVGLMMAHVMGISDERALKNACDLGIAMQLTNIARDVGTDFELGRCYLPADLLAKHGLSFDNYWSLENRAALFRAVDELLTVADRYYRSGEEGTIYLRRSTALVIWIARYSYAAIGEKVRAHGERAWAHRQFTSKLEKCKCLFKALWSWGRQSLTVLHVPWRAAIIQQVWRMQ